MIHLLRSTAVFAVRLLLSVAVVYRFSHAENKSIFAQRYGLCTPPDGTKHTNVRRTGTKYKTNVKNTYYALIPCGFSALAPLAEMRYTGKAKTNVKEKRSSNCESAFGAARRACRGKAPPSANADRSAA